MRRRDRLIIEQDGGYVKLPRCGRRRVTTRRLHVRPWKAVSAKQAARGRNPSESMTRMHGYQSDGGHRQARSPPAWSFFEAKGVWSAGTGDSAAPWAPSRTQTCSLLVRNLNPYAADEPPVFHRRWNTAQGQRGWPLASGEPFPVEQV